ncbi:mitochondrial inner membrane protease subunit 2 [Polychytrium aggregatum]|uniref:mitochondrial inner membrane protease subunit 2 n=1 Tax=Polychytrium aggregatum TaxID=110093 RepID=UPI0022FE7CFB|nr:mitochondrial inner membrane protease subunit 2 [Polychytrium aggregatum]KAI9207526.1 mitochondrial inner membrane protease subunit 2 [Polychytrium aggregatum]
MAAAPAASTGSFARRLGFFAVTFVPPAILFNDYVASVATVKGRSMQPTFNPDSNGVFQDIVLLDRWSITNHRYRRGDVVFFTAPHNPDMILIKRIIALEGDTVRPRPKYVSANLPPMPINPVKIPKGHCWLEGDESFHGIDSNNFGPVPLGLVTSRVSFVLWPLDRFGLVRSRMPSGRLLEER